MDKIRELVEKYQLLLIVIVVLLFCTRECSNNNYIEEKERRYSLLRDSLLSVSIELYKQNEVKRLQNESLLLENHLLHSSIEKLDRAIVDLRRIYKHEADNIDKISIDSNISILSKHLSQDTKY